MDGFGDVLSARLPWGGDEPGILVLLHLDTVHAVGTVAGPLPLRRDGDRVYGPGIHDMKGGAYLACRALRQLLRAGRRPRLPAQVLCIPDEEVGSPSTRPLIERAAASHRDVLVAEPSRGGRLTTGRHAFLRYRVHVHGRPAHAGADNLKGRSAIRAMALHARARALAGRLGFDVDHGQSGGGSDGNFTGALGVPTLDGLGVLGDGAHTHGEHLLVSSLEPRARLLAGRLGTLD